MSDDPIARCREVILRHSKSFSLAARLLPAEVRDEAVVLYAWCRGCDDAIDEAPRDEGPAALAGLRAQLDRLYTGQPRDEPIELACAALFARRALPRAYPEALIEGMATDVHLDRHADLASLLAYCHRVAGVVGLMMCHLLGVRDDRALLHAAHLGIAMQLSNISRDVHEDWQRGRLYLPLARLGEAAGPLETALDAGAELPRQCAPQLSVCIGELLALAARYYRSADRGLVDLGGRCAFSIRVARKVYAAIGARVARGGCDPWAGRAVVSTPHKLALVALALARSLGELPRRTLDRRPLRAPSRELTVAQSLDLA